MVVRVVIARKGLCCNWCVRTFPKLFKPSSKKNKDQGPNFDDIATTLPPKQHRSSEKRKYSTADKNPITAQSQIDMERVENR